MMTDQELKEQYIENHILSVKDMIKQGQVNAFIQVIATNPDIDKPIMMHIDVPSGSDDEKEAFAKVVIPMLKDEIKEHKYDVVLVSFTSEAWIRKANKDEVPDDYKELPISDEVVIFTISEGDGDEFRVYDIVRNDLQVDENGELVEKIDEFDKDGNALKNVELLLNEELTMLDKEKTSKSKGRFSNLYNKLK